MDTHELIAALCVVSIAGLIRGFAGFGAALAMAPPLSIIYGPTNAIMIIAIIEVIGSLQLLPGALRVVNWRSLMPLGLSACITIPLGSYTISILDPVLIQQSIAVIVLAFCFVMLTGWSPSGQGNIYATVGTGALSGFLAGSSGMAGPPVILYFLSSTDVAQKARANFIIFFAITGFVTLISILSIGQVDKSNLSVVLILCPLFLIFTWLGTRFFSRASTKIFRHIALILLISISTLSLLKT